MSDLRQELMDAGWQQGVIVAPGVVEYPAAVGFLVLNQTCDCISPDLENEPSFELLPLVSLEQAPDANLLNGQNARRIHLQIQQGDRDIWVGARMADICFFDRSRYKELIFATDLSIAQPVIDGVISWRAARYLRPAFPDDFEKAIRAPLSKVKKFIKREEALIDSILISLDPFDELTEGEMYEVQIRLMVRPEVMGVPDQVKRLSAVASKIKEHFSKSDALIDPNCMVTALDEMTLWDKTKFVDFSRYDYLSFGEESTEE